MMDEKRLADIKVRADKATKGPWEINPRNNYIINEEDTIAVVESVDGDLWIYEADAEFITNARQDVPELVAEVERLRAIIIEAGCYLAYGESGDAHKTLYNGMSEGDYEYFERINDAEEAKFEEKRIQFIEELR